MKKTISVVLVCILLMALLTACGKKEIDAATFTQKASALGYQTSDQTEEVKKDYNYIQSYIDAGKANVDINQWDVSFIVATSEGDASGIYNNNASNYDKVSGNASTTSTNHTNSYKKTGGGRFMYVCRVNTTVLVVDVNEQYKEEAEKLIKEIGY